jgi:hypothetical protein
MLTDDFIVGKKVLVLLAHYDDEIFLLPFINLIKNANVHLDFYYLTDSRGRNGQFSSEIRKKESARYLSKCQMSSYSMQDFENQARIKDGHLHEFLEETFANVKSIINKYDILLTPIWENGHTDHDCIWLIGDLLRDEIEHLCFPIYSKSNTILPFQVQGINKKVIESKKIDLIKIKNNIYVMKKTIGIPWIFKSQIKSWIGLYPFLLMNSLIRKNYIFCKTNKDFNIYFDQFNRINRVRSSKNFDEWKLKVRKFHNDADD